MMWTCCKVLLSRKQFGPTGENIPKEAAEDSTQTNGGLHAGKLAECSQIVKSTQTLRVILNKKCLF